MALNNGDTLQSSAMTTPRSPGTHIVGPWVIDSINSYRDLRTGTQYVGNWASRDYPLLLQEGWLQGQVEAKVAEP